jgi:hypothetical protein
MGEMASKIDRSKMKYARKIKDAAHLLFFQHHRLPGVRGWELRKELGSEWRNILDVIDPTSTQMADARYYIIMKGTIDQKMAKTIGWRIDDIAGLAVSVAYIISKQGKALRMDVEKVLKEKLPGWRVRLNIDKYIQQGYLGEDEQGILFLDWRTRAEIDRKKLVDLIVGFGNKAA